MTGNVIPLTPRTDRQPSRAAAHDTSHAPADATATPIGRAVYTVTEVAKLLSLSLGSTYTLIRNGEIPARKMGGRWVVPKRRFHAWLDDLPEATDADIARELRRLDRNGA